MLRNLKGCLSVTYIQYVYFHEMQTSCSRRHIIYKILFGEDNIDLAKIILY